MSIFFFKLNNEGEVHCVICDLSCELGDDDEDHRHLGHDDDDHAGK